MFSHIKLVRVFICNRLLWADLQIRQLQPIDDAVARVLTQTKKVDHRPSLSQLPAAL